MTREQAIEQHKQQVSTDNQVKPEQVYVFDADNAPKIDHNWKQYGTRFVCDGGTHSRHAAWSRPM